jgi:hypothetical protein
MSSRLDAKRAFNLLLHEMSFKKCTFASGKENSITNILTLFFSKNVVYVFETGSFKIL